MNKDNIEFTLEEGKEAIQLHELLEEKAKEKIKLEKTPNLSVLKKSKFYKNDKSLLREHIANYNGYAIMIPQEKIKEELNNKETKMFPVIVKMEELSYIKKVNGNIVRKIQPKSLHLYEKMSMIQGVIKKIDELGL